MVNLGPDSTEGKLQFQKDDEIEERDTFKENLRCGIAGLLPIREDFFFSKKKNSLLFVITTQICLQLIAISPVGLKALRDVGVDVVSVDPCSDPECVAESAALTAWRFQGLKSESKRKSEVEIVLHSSEEKRYVYFIFLHNCTKIYCPSIYECTACYGVIVKMLSKSFTYFLSKNNQYQISFNCFLLSLLL